MKLPLALCLVVYLLAEVSAKPAPQFLDQAREMMEKAKERAQEAMEQAQEAISNAFETAKTAVQKGLNSAQKNAPSKLGFGAEQFKQNVQSVTLNTPAA